LRGNETEWAENDIVIPDGELAVLQHSSGITRIKIGNGTSRFSELQFVGQHLTKLTEDSAVLNPTGDGDYKCGIMRSLTLTLPSVPEDGFSFAVTFKSDTEVTNINITGGSIYFTGDGCADGTLYPDFKTSYTLFVWYDGSYQGVVRGVPYE
jgi:hypothetical protein